MKIEKRGKYPGVKVHLDPIEVQSLIKLSGMEGGLSLALGGKMIELQLPIKLGKKLSSLIQEDPDTLQDRTPEQIEQVVIAEAKSAEAKLVALHSGKDWKHCTKAEVMK